MNRALLSSERHDWATPRSFFAEMDREFNFTLDVCATADNACLPRYFTPDDDALSKSWQGERCWMNPPFGYGIKHWVRKAYDESRSGAQVVCLLPARTDTAWWHDYVIRAKEIRFIRGRLMFGGPHKEDSHNAPFPCAIVIFDGGVSGPTAYTTMDRILDEVNL